MKKKKEKQVSHTEKMFAIDFFELSFLAEACIPPRPIARTCFWYDMIDKYYHQMSQNQRDRLHEWMQLNHSYKAGLQNGNEDVLLFDARYDPKKQYVARTLFEGKEKDIDCFLHAGEYRTERNVYVDRQYIVSVEKKFKCD